jgi:hypothetical protein
MDVVLCHACEREVNARAQACLHCGALLPPRPIEAEAPDLAPPAAVLPATAADQAGELHALALHKLVVLSMCTLGLYQVYWFWRNWKRVAERTGRPMMPFWRAVFAPLWSYSLFDEVREQARRAEIPAGWLPSLMAVAFFLLSAAWRFGGAGMFVSMLSFLPLVPVQATINDLAARRGTKPDSRLDARHLAVIAAGSVFVVLAIVGTFIPPQ